MDPDSLERAVQAVLAEGKLTPKAVVTVDLFGLPADHDRIRQIADRYGLYILEDAAQGFGGTCQGRRAGSFGDIATTSFFRQSRWGATETAAPSLQIPTTGRRLFVLSGFTERAVISTTMCASA